MADTAAHLVDRVLPEVPARQWVLSLPFPLSYRMAYDAALTHEILNLFLRTLFASLRRRARKRWGVRSSQPGKAQNLVAMPSRPPLPAHRSGA
jgi:hypothetical protein